MALESWKILQGSTFVKKLESELLNSIDIFPDDKGKLVVVSASVLVRDVLLENQTLQRELNVWRTKSTNFNKIIDQATSQIRSVIRQEMTRTPWPFHPSDVNNSAYISITDQPQWLLVGLLTGNPDSKSHCSGPVI